MIKIVRADWTGAHLLALKFSDGSEGLYDFASLICKDTVLTRPLTETKYFQRFFLELGALCWPNGLEFNGASLHKDLLIAGKLTSLARAA